MAVLTKFASLIDKIPTNTNNKELNSMWIINYPVLKEQLVAMAEPMTVTVNEAQKYRGDLAGLFAIKGVKSQFILPNILVNGYTCSDDYDGQVLEFVRLNEVPLQRLLVMTLRTNTFKDKLKTRE